MVSHEEIAQVAHYLYEKSGRVPGRDIDNWLEAERIVTSRQDNGGESRGADEFPARAPRGMRAATEATIVSENAAAKKRTATRSTAKAGSEAKKPAAKRTSRAKKAE